MADRPDAVKLPNASAAVVPAAKLTNYLLSPTHPHGKSKAAYFARLGYDGSVVTEFAERLIAIAVDNEVVEEEVSAFGIKYTVEGWMPAANGGQAGHLRVVWIIPTGEAVPRLVTAYPA